MLGMIISADREGIVKTEQLKKRNNQRYTYKTIVLDTVKYNRWFTARKQNNPRVSHSSIARQIGYGRAYLSRILNQTDCDIEVSARFIGTFLDTFGLDFDEIFTVIKVNQQQGIHQQERPYMYLNNFQRFDDTRMPHVNTAR